ncbi:phosphoribosylformylglycinamidine synthase subunit PurQ [Sphingobacteriales bacterium UPWRP_1]|nr:phosphoribosylformylglycinamidine synthase [Sphingobacteriales bacterium TSM_CSS]PSJ74776.1 phosphoribosylformylglycinamidine synthase subunit PurQ [Sphingobacteriales bacterium UPWRP_1]
MNQVKSLVITGFGINCEEETNAAYLLAGAQSEIVHLNDILIKGFDIHAFDIVNFPGGFSFGDDISSGKVLANKIKYKQLSSGTTLFQELLRFLSSGKFIFGACNGFQVLVKLGLLPNINGLADQEVTLMRNNSGKYEDRWVTCRVTAGTHTPFLKGIDRIALPVRHGEGKLVIKNEAIRQQIIDQKLNCLSYCDEQGNPTDVYPMNPNGAELNCAGLTNPTGQVFGLMPHPEAYLSLYNHPNWGQKKRQNPRISEEGEGLAIFKNIVHHIANTKIAAIAPSGAITT